MSGSHRIFIGVLIVMLAAAAVAALAHKSAPIEARPAAETMPAQPQPLPAASPEAGPALLARSPFAPDRSAYARIVESAPPPVEAPPEVRLVAVFSAQGAPRATLVIGGEEVTVGVGDETRAGAVVAIEADAVVLGGGEGRRVGLFDR